MKNQIIENSFPPLQEDEDCQRFVHELIKQFQHTPPTFDAFMLRARLALLSAIVFYIHQERWPTEQNLTSVMKLLEIAKCKIEDDGYYEPALDIIFKWWAEKTPEHFGLREYDVFKQATPETANTIVENIQENMRCLGFL